MLQMKDYERIAQEGLKKLEEELGIKIDIAVEPDINELTIEQLQEYLDDLEDRLGELEDNEPEDEDSDEYDEWEEKYSEVEELIEEVTERLEQLRGKNIEKE